MKIVPEFRPAMEEAEVSSIRHQNFGQTPTKTVGMVRGTVGKP